MFYWKEIREKLAALLPAKTCFSYKHQLEKRTFNFFIAEGELSFTGNRAKDHSCNPDDIIFTSEWNRNIAWHWIGFGSAGSVTPTSPSLFAQ